MKVVAPWLKSMQSSTDNIKHITLNRLQILIALPRHDTKMKIKFPTFSRL